MNDTEFSQCLTDTINDMMDLLIVPSFESVTDYLIDRAASDDSYGKLLIACCKNEDKVESFINTFINNWIGATTKSRYVMQLNKQLEEMGFTFRFSYGSDDTSDSNDG